MSDSLLDAILADPESDDARLVWADREGGERGELVVVQCALASGKGSAPERLRLQRRQSELLTRVYGTHDLMLNGEPMATSLDFERGFLVAATVLVHAIAPLLDRHPLVRKITLTRQNGRRVEPPDWRSFLEQLRPLLPSLGVRIHTLELSAEVWSTDVLHALHAAETLRGIAFLDRRFERDQLPFLEPLRALEALSIHPGFDIPTLVDALPNLRSVALLHCPRGALSRLADMPNLEALDLTGSLIGHLDYAELASLPLPKLRKLDLSLGPNSVPALTALAKASFAPNLRELAVDGTITPSSIPHLRAFPKLERLHVSADKDVRAVLAETIRHVL